MGQVTVSNLGKAYKQYTSRWSRLREWLMPFAGACHTNKWVLQDINFTIQPGEAVGIVGVNGAGKSTLLKLITGTTQPTTGSAQVTGRLAALLELGMGFHPDFTGRQNAIMSGHLLGMTSEEIAQRMPEIEAFAEIGEYIDAPVRVYSSGMQMRLAFSVATAKRPDILIVDEALSVGDSYFQHKSFDRIREFGQQGTTLLVVSHDKTAIQSICNRAILLDGGRVGKEGAPDVVMDYYNALLAERGNKTVRQLVDDQGRAQTVSGSGEAAIEDVGIFNEQGERLEVVNVGQPIQLNVDVLAKQALNELVVGYVIKDRFGQAVYGTNTHHLDDKVGAVDAGARLRYRFRFPANLGVGSYSISVALHREDSHIVHNYEWRDLAVVFSVINVDKSNFVGVSWLPPQMECKR